MQNQNSQKLVQLSKNERVTQKKLHQKGKIFRFIKRNIKDKICFGNIKNTKLPRIAKFWAFKRRKTFGNTFFRIWREKRKCCRTKILHLFFRMVIGSSEFTIESNGEKFTNSKFPMFVLPLLNIFCFCV